MRYNTAYQFPGKIISDMKINGNEGTTQSYNVVYNHQSLNLNPELSAIKAHSLYFAIEWLSIQ